MSAVAAQPDYEVSYALSRKELWRGYWLKWKLERGRYYARVSLGTMLAAILVSWIKLGSLPPRVIAIAAVGACACFVGITALTALMSQMLYSAGRRTLRLDRDGWSATRDAESDSRSWADIHSVIDAGGLLLITSSNGDFLCIPASAFRDELQRRECVAACLRWHQRLTAGT